MGKVYDKAAETMRRYRSLPNLGAGWVPTKDARPDAHFICAETGQFAQIHLDLLQEWAEKHDAHVFIRVNPGDFLYRGEPLADIYLNDGSSSLTEEDLSLLRSFFIVKPTRSYEQDPRFGFIVLKEIAQRSISPSMNDPGSVIAVMNLMAKLLLDATAPRDNETVYDRIGMEPLQETDFIYRSFDGIIRDSDQNAGVAHYVCGFAPCPLRNDSQSGAYSSALDFRTRAPNIQHPSGFVSRGKRLCPIFSG